jgi:O-acetyl-ADP-ribose deacetylase (regulator of RNase III)
VIRVVQAKLEEVEADAVARPVGSDGEAVSAAGRRLGLAAGDAVEERLQRLGEMPTGGAFLTPAGTLPARFLVHLVVRSAMEPATHQTIRKALANGLARARDWELASLAIPPLGLGAGNLESEAAAELVVSVLREHLLEKRPPRDLLIVVESEYEELVFGQALERGGAPNEDGAADPGGTGRGGTPP